MLDRVQQRQGTNGKWSFWRFVDPKTKQPIPGDMTWQGSLDCLLSNGSTGTATSGAATDDAACDHERHAGNASGSTQCQEFPINIVNVLSFLILVYLAGRFAEGIDRIASELSNAYLLLDTGGKLDQFLASQGKSSGSSGGGIGGGINRLLGKPGGNRA
ncbi:MAG: hypothetical protein WDN72_02845 [Alphaproteobacteria bacterium]